MSSSFSERGVPPAAQEDTAGKGAAAASPAAPFPNWFDRMQNVRARHEAITRNLNTWSNYKHWAERMRTTWSEEADGEAAAPLDDPSAPSNH